VSLTCTRRYVLIVLCVLICLLPLVDFRRLTFVSIDSGSRFLGMLPDLVRPDLVLSSVHSE